MIPVKSPLLKLSLKPTYGEDFKHISLPAIKYVIAQLFMLKSFIDLRSFTQYD